MITSGTDTPADVTPDVMVIDTNDADIFSSLDDLVVEDAPTQHENITKDDVAEDENATEEVEESDDDEVNFDDIEDLEQDTEGYDIEKEDSDEEGEDSEEDDGEADDEAQEEEVAEGDDDEEVDYEGYMVTLPDGEELSLATAVQGYKDAQALASEREEFETYKSEFKQQSENVSKRLELAQLEADKVIEDYKDFDWAGLAKEDPQLYVENKEFLERYMQRSKELKAAVAEQESQKEQAEKEEFQLRARSAVATLQEQIPGWNQDMYSDLIEYAVGTGVPESEILKATDPTIFILLNKARQFDKGKQIVKAKVKRQTNSPKKVVKAQSKSVQQPGKQKIKLEKMLDAGITDNADVFANLED